MVQMDDIVPQLYKKILNEFNNQVKKDAWIKSFEDRQKKGIATQKDVQEYAGRIGKYGQLSLIHGLRKDNLPDGIIYWNIAKRTVEPLMRKMTDMVNKAYSTELSSRYKKMKLGIKPVTAKFNQERCDAIMNKLVAASMAAAQEAKAEETDAG